ncbi:MAG: hypothetical protein HZA46_20210, partial [Planctomycetales bacterium]|nr:hypothetical protein [Planctomycetales bacterium]
YKRFEETLLKLAEVLRKTDPDRATLLVRAIGRSREDLNYDRMLRVVELLKQDKFGDAIEQQGELMSQLQGLLDLLLSEDRAKEIAAEKARLEAYLKDLNKLIGQQKDVRAATERGEPADGLAGRQEKVAEKTGDLGKKIDKDDASKNEKKQDGSKKRGDEKSKDGQSGKPKDGKDGEGEPKDGEPSDKDGDKSDADKADADKKDKDGEKPKTGDKKAKPGDKKDGDKKKGDKSSKPGQPKDGEPKDGQPKDGQPQDGQPQDGKPQDGQQQDDQKGEQQPQQDKTPGRQELEQAKREMEKAIEKLKKKQNQEASDDQDEALKKLIAAKEKLEDILRQLREEERMRKLAALEARFQRMLAQQLLVYDGTVKLDKTSPSEKMSTRVVGRAAQLARQEDEIAIEATKALTLLREEGSAVAFPEAVEQMRDDMRHVAERLDRTDVAELTQAIERDIIDALEEMIDALQKEMEKNDEKKKKQQQQKDQQPQDQALVDQLAELKMLRSLQLRVNNRTRQLGSQVQGEQALETGLVQQLQRLADRQARIQQATYDLATGKNK